MKVDVNRIYLEDIGEIVMSRGGKDIWLVKEITQLDTFRGRDLPDKIYVVDFPGRGLGEEFLLSRQACGAEKFLMIKEIGHDMMRLFERMFDGNLAQFVILWGGRPLDLLDANPPLQRSRLLDTTYIRAVAQIEFYLLTPAHLVRLISGFFSSRFLQTHK